MFLSIFEVFKIGIGPSSSHTMGPMVAAKRFIDLLWETCAREKLEPKSLDCTLYGSLAFTGKGHATDRAVVLGLVGFVPDSIDPDKIDDELDRVAREKQLDFHGLNRIDFVPSRDVKFDYGPALPNNFFCFAFNLNKNTFLSFMIFENTLENIKLFCPEMAPVIDDRNLTIDVMSLLPPRIELLVSKNNIEALRGYNTQVVYQCHNHFFSASTSFLLNN